MTNHYQGTLAEQSLSNYCRLVITSQAKGRISTSTIQIVTLASAPMSLGIKSQACYTSSQSLVALGNISQSTSRSALKARLGIIQQLFLLIGLGSGQSQFLYVILLQLGISTIIPYTCTTACRNTRISGIRQRPPICIRFLGRAVQKNRN